jgi:hypothetical protein
MGGGLVFTVLVMDMMVGEKQQRNPKDSKKQDEWRICIMQPGC